MKEKRQAKKTVVKRNNKKLESAKRKPIKKSVRKIKESPEKKKEPVTAKAPQQKKLRLLKMEGSQALKIFILLLFLTVIGLCAWAIKIYPEKDIRAKLTAINRDFNIFYQQARASALDISRVILPDPETESEKAEDGDNYNLSDCPDCSRENGVFYDATEEKKLTWGNPQADTVFVVYNDFASPFSKKLALETLPILKTRLGDKILFQHRDFPLSELNPFIAEKAAIAVRCAARQEQFLPMHNRLFEYQQLWRDPETAVDFFQIFATEIGLDTKLFSECLYDPAAGAAVKADYNKGLEDGIRGVPTVKISKNGITKTIEGVLSAKDYERLLNEF